MSNIKFILAFLFICSASVFAQKSIHEYKYIIVPSQYHFQKSEDAYQVNSLTKFLFEKENFSVYLSNDNQHPKELKLNKCLALTAKITDVSKMLSTKLNIDLVDCNNNIIFSSKEGTSRKKEYTKAYHQAIRRAFESIKALNYSYTEKNTKTIIAQQITDTKKETDILEEKTVIKDESKIIETNKATEKIIEIPSIKEKEVIVLTSDSNLLYAQPNSNGFQLIDSSPKVVYILQKTSVENVFILKNKNGVLHSLDGQWIAEYYENNKLINKVLKIKF